MNVVKLQGRLWRTRDDFYAALFDAIGAPDWHGDNLDALNDSLAGDDINEVRQPLHIFISGVNEMSTEAREQTERLRELVIELRFAGHAVDITYE
jgi:RNAse (barnase) inhibitor barstar